MITTEINGAALAIAAEFVVGFEATARIGALYKLIDKAMFDGYELGKIDGERNFQEACDTSFDTGYETGVMQAHVEGLNEGWDNGYLDGVGDARARPAHADQVVCDIINDMAQQAINGEFEQD